MHNGFTLSFSVLFLLFMGHALFDFGVYFLICRIQPICHHTVCVNTDSPRFDATFFRIKTIGILSLCTGDQLPSTKL